MIQAEEKFKLGYSRQFSFIRELHTDKRVTCLP